MPPSPVRRPARPAGRARGCRGGTRGPMTSPRTNRPTWTPRRRPEDARRSRRSEPDRVGPVARMPERDDTATTKAMTMATDPERRPVIARRRHRRGAPDAEPRRGVARHRRRCCCGPRAGRSTRRSGPSSAASGSSASSAAGPSLRVDVRPIRACHRRRASSWAPVVVRVVTRPGPSRASGGLVPPSANDSPASAWRRLRAPSTAREAGHPPRPES